LSLTAFAALTLAYIGYINLAPAGVLGEDQRIKFEEQTTTTLGTSPLGLVLGGRPQVYGAILGIKERPILGFGSWRHDLTSVFVVDAFTDVGNDPRLIDHMNKTGAVSGAGHSVLFQAWVENGIVPAACWILIAFIALKVSVFNIQNNNIYTAFFIINLGAFFWTFFFSPPPVFLRYLVGIYMAYYVVFLDKKAPLRHAGELC
jgi:O-antigen ligase